MSLPRFCALPQLRPAGAGAWLLRPCTLLPPHALPCATSPGWPSPATWVPVKGWSPGGPLRCLHQPPAALASVLGPRAWPPSHCPLLSDPQNGTWGRRCSGLWAQAPRGHWMTTPLQDPATYDSRPSAPTRRGTGRLCLPLSLGAGALGSHCAWLACCLWSHSMGPSQHFCPQPDPWQCRFSAFPHVWSRCPGPTDVSLHPYLPASLGPASQSQPEPGTNEPEAMFLVQVKAGWGSGLFHFSPPTDTQTPRLPPPLCVWAHAPASSPAGGTC